MLPHNKENRIEFWSDAQPKVVIYFHILNGNQEMMI